MGVANMVANARMAHKAPTDLLLSGLVCFFFLAFLLLFGGSLLFFVLLVILLLRSFLGRGFLGSFLLLKWEAVR